MSFINFLKKFPIDLGQANNRFTTKGKLIALSFVKNSRKKALDIGCREGYQSEILKKKGYDVISIDIKKNYKDCIIVDVNEGLPFKDFSFDLIWCSELIEHLNNPKKSLKEFRRVLNKNGVMIVTTPNSYCIPFRLFSLFGITPKKIQNKEHQHFFNIDSIKKMFPKAKIYGFFPYFIIKMKISKFVGLLSPTFIIYEKKI